MVYAKAPTVEDIMTTDIIRYNEDYKDRLKKICERLDITYLPDREGKNFYQFIPDDKNPRFKKLNEDDEKIKRRRTSPDKKIFSEEIFEQFKGLKGGDDVKTLFVYDHSELVGIMHFSDYNSEPAFVYLYSLLFNFENKLRKLLELSGKKNEDIIEFFGKKLKEVTDKDERKFYERAYGRFIDKKTEEIKDDMKEKMDAVSEFQWFYLKELISFINENKLDKIGSLDPQGKINDLRNTVMHSKNAVKEESNNNDKPIVLYDFKSFIEFIEAYEELIWSLSEVGILIEKGALF